MKPLTLPNFDMDSFVALTKANMDALMKAQTVMAEACQAAAKMQYGFMAEYVDQMQAMAAGKFAMEKKPEAYMADMKAAAEKAVSVAQMQVDLGMKAQAEAMDLLTKRAQANVNELQKLSA